MAGDDDVVNNLYYRNSPKTQSHLEGLENLSNKTRTLL